MQRGAWSCFARAVSVRQPRCRFGRTRPLFAGLRMGGTNRSRSALELGQRFASMLGVSSHSCHMS
eukprot:12296316-Alexandrium_andersonii.AAC.1